MWKMLKKLEGAFGRLLEILASISLLALFISVVLTVFARYVFHASLGVEEMPVYLMIVCVWITVPIAAKYDNHIKISVMESLIKNKTINALRELVLRIILVGALGIYAKYCIDYVGRSKLLGTVTAGLRIPYWTLQSVMTFGICVMFLYYVGHLCKDVKRLVEVVRCK